MVLSINAVNDAKMMDMAWEATQLGAKVDVTSTESQEGGTKSDVRRIITISYWTHATAAKVL